MIVPSFFLEQFLELVTEEIWECSKDKIITAYKKNKNASEKAKSFETRMYTAIVDAFCMYASIDPQNARPDIMDFIYTTAETYFNESQRKKDNTSSTLLQALHSFDSKFSNTALLKNYENKKEEDDAKIEMVEKYLQKYILKDDKFKDEYINEVLERLLKIGHRIERKQIEHGLFPKQVIADVKESLKETEYSINSNTVKESDRVIVAVSDKIDSLAKERFSEPYTGQETKHEFEKPMFKDIKTEYVEKWNERLFLHRKPEDDELTLHNTYISTLYITLIPESDRTCEPQDNLNEKLEQFIERGKSLLLIGPPGIGKTSIVCYLADKYKNDPDVIILRFSDWSEEEWAHYESKTNGSILMKVITNKLGCSEKDLRNKILILDGFDETKYYMGRDALINAFLLQIRSIRGLRIIITSRDNYININKVKFQNVIKLYPFNESKIIKFCKKISQNFEIKEDEILLIDKEVYGIPVILYMAIVTGIDITINSSRYKAYEKIFSSEGGIFDRFATISTEGYDDSSTHDISYEKEYFINILCKTAFTMFRVHNNNLIDFKTYQKIIDDESQYVVNKIALWFDFPINNLYESSDHLEFVHKSIYEYFVAESIYYQLLKILQLPDNSVLTDRLSVIADLLCANIFTNEIIEFMRYRIRNSELNTMGIFNKLKSLLTNLLDRGPTNFITNSGCENPPPYFKIYGKFLCNNNIIFWNLLSLIHCWSQIKNYQGLPFSGGDLSLEGLAVGNDSWRAECIIYENIQYEFDPLINLIISYLRHLDDISNIDLSYMGFFCLKRKKHYDFSKFQENIRLLAAGIISVVDGFSSLTLSNINFTKSIFYEMDFNYSKIVEGEFNNTVILSSNMSHAEFDNVHFYTATFNDAKFKKSSFVKGIFAYTNIYDCYFENCYFNQTEFLLVNSSENNTFINCIFDNVILSGSFDNCVFSNCSFKSVKLTYFVVNSYKKADFRGSTFSDRCELTGGVFTSADFRGADLDGAIYTHELDDAILG